MITRKMTLSVLLALLIGAVAGFLATIAIVSGAGGESSQVDSRALEVATLEEAKEAASYDIATPNYLPDGFERSSTTVFTLLTKNRDKTVVQTWTGSGGDWDYIVLEQAPNLAGIGDQGSPVIIRGISGERVLRSTDDPSGTESDQLSLFWREAGRGFVLTGSLGTSLTEEDLIRIAESVDPA